MQPEVCHHSQNWDQPQRRSQGWSHRCCRASPEEECQSQSPEPSPTGPHWWVTFLDPGMTSEEEQVLEQASTDLDLGPPLELRPNFECFLQELTIMQEEGRGSDLSQGPPVEDYEDWIEWREHRDSTPDWWRELVGIPGINNFQELTQKIRAIFEIPWVRSKAIDMENDYSAPPAPKCICQKEFLPPPNLMFPCQDIREGQSQKILAYAQTLQYLTEMSNPLTPGWPCLLPRCMLELRRVMEPCVAFLDKAILEGAGPWGRSLEIQTWATIPVKTQLAPT